VAIEIRPARQDEMGQLGLLSAYVYGGAFGDGPNNITSSAQRPEWTLCAFDGDRMVSMFATTPFTMRTFGRAVPMGGISSVGTLPEYRRQGLLRKIMTQALAEMREKGQAITSLWASQAAIYQRYQFALASIQRSYTVDTIDIGFHDGNEGSCSVTQTVLAESFDIIKSMYIEHVRDQFCYLHRSSALWQHSILGGNDQDGPLHSAICRDAAGSAVGYLLYTLRSDRIDHRTRSQEIKIRELIAMNADAYRSLWNFIAKHDLVGRVHWGNVPSDDPAPELFMEPRLLHAMEGEGLWFRIVDVAKALGARGYQGEHQINIGVQEDKLAPWNTGCYQLNTSIDGAEVSSNSAPADIQCSIKSLSSLYTGYRSARDLANWGLISGEHDKIALADAVFSTPFAPHCPDHF